MPNELYIPGKLVKYKELGDKIYFTEPFVELNLLYKGWYTDEKNIPESNADNKKIVNRENMRLRASLEEGRRLSPDKPIVAVLHFPPVYGTYLCEEITKTLADFGVKLCLYGHIHGIHRSIPDTVHNGITYKMVSADHLNFKPYKIIY